MHQYVCLSGEKAHPFGSYFKGSLTPSTSPLPKPPQIKVENYSGGLGRSFIAGKLLLWCSTLTMLEQSLEKLGNIRLSRGHSAKIWTLVGLGWGAEIFVGFFSFFFLATPPQGPCSIIITGTL